MKFEIIELTSRLKYEPQMLSSRRATSLPTKEIESWRSRLGFPTYAVTKTTLVNTTQMVKTLQAETRECMQDHYKTRVWALRPHRINDVMYSDTFFASIKSIRGFKCFQMFAFKNSKFDRLTLVHKEASAPEAYEECIRAVGAQKNGHRQCSSFNRHQVD